MVSVPDARPDIVPDAEPIVASVGVLLLQVPPVEELVSVVVEPTHTLFVPPIAAGSGFTVTVVTVKHPAGSV